MSWRLAIRSLRGTPVSTAMAVLSLALGIGACTALYSILDTLLLRTLPVSDPTRLVQAHNGRDNTSWTNPQWEHIRDHRPAGEAAFAWSSGRFDLSGSGATDFVDGAYVSGSYFDALGVRPILGRVLTGADDRHGGGAEGPAAVIGYGLWQRRYGGAPDVIGRSVTLESVPFTIVGVLPPGFFGTAVGRRMDVAIPIGAEPLLRGKTSGLDHRSYWWLSVMFRLRGDETLEQAEKTLRAVQPSIREATLPDDWPPDLLKDYLAEPLGLLPAASGESYLRERYRRPLVTLMIAVSLLLLVACANIANLMLARASGRRHELAVRAALGGGRSALARPLLAESVVVAAAGAALGLAFAQWASRALVAGLTTSSNRVFLDLSLNPGVLAFTLGATTLATIVFGTIPAFTAARARPAEALAERGRTLAGSGGRFTLSGLLVATQVALSLVLVVAAGLFGRSFAALTALDLGFDRKPVLLVDVNAVRSATDLPGQTRLFAGIREAALEVPGVGAAAVSAVTPASGRTWMFGVEVEGEAPPPANEPSVYVNMITPGWFATYGTRVIAGRDLAASDTAGAPRAGLVNEAFVRRYLPGKNPVGRVLRQRHMAKPTEPITIVGVVEDAVYRSLRQPPPATLYLAFAQLDRPLHSSEATLSVRSAGPPPSTFIRALTRKLSDLDPSISFTFRPLAEQVEGTLVQERLVALLSGFFGALAVLLAAVGLYGVTSYAVGRRRAEFGLRMALGGSPRTIVALTLKRVLVMLAVGVVAGAVASYWAATLVKTLLFGLEPRDPATFAGAAAILAAVGLLAGYLPARRAARLDPVEVLREG